MPRSQSLAFAIKHRTSFRRPSTSHGGVRLPYFQHAVSISRHFTPRPSLFHLVRPHCRPQLPFLYPSGGSGPHFRHAQQTLLARFMTTERKQRWRARLRWQLRFHAYFWPSLMLLALMLVGVKQTRLEQLYPTPAELSFWCRWHLRKARYVEADGSAQQYRRAIDWAMAARWYKEALDRMENQQNDGRGIKKQGDDGGDILVDGLGRTGFDITEKSEPWRRAYHQALMGCARVAENLEGMAKRKDEQFGRLIPWASVIGPNNPRPKPLPWDKKGQHLNPPTVNEMEAAFDKPEVFYMRILTTNGFTPRQRLDAAIGYADYLDFKGLYDTADNMYDWALDIAAGALPEGANDVVNMKTGVINAGKDEFVSENLLRATTAMGVHYARKGDVKLALPIFLGVLRARRSLPALPEEMQKVQAAEKSQVEHHPLMRYTQAVKQLFFDPPYPAPPSDGNKRPYHSLQEACEEVGIMTYIGEILFATSGKEREKGLSWTRDSVGAAEAVLWTMDEMGEGDSPGKDRCRECLETGLDNWKQMARQMARAASASQADVANGRGWLGLGIGKQAALAEAHDHVRRWEEEETQIELRKLKTASLVHPLKPYGSSWVRA